MESNEIQQIAERLRRLPESERSFVVDALCGDDQVLRQQIGEILQTEMHEQSECAITRTRNSTDVFDPGLTADAETAPLYQEKRDADPASFSIPNYRIIRPIGKGGMGQVFLADQMEPVKRRVAVKVIKTEAPSREVLARFDAERQALAIMDHPNIARVYDAGVTQDGQPFFAMEFVGGVSITKYCEENELRLNQRLELFTQTCRAIHHAHQKGIIHRDIKPSNILVTLYDGKPAAKVIDFGLAKALQTTTFLDDHSVQTLQGQVLGTLEYMSPEQARLNSVDIDTRTDVYSLGVVFYELLTGSTPITREKVSELPFDEVLRQIREEEAVPPGSRIASRSKSLEKVASKRRIDPRRFAGMLRRDLDWIALKALEKDRSRRYSSPAELADEVQRFLDDEQIQARPPSLAYKMRKSFRKHKTQYLAGTGVALAIMICGFLGWQIWRAQQFDAQRQGIITEINRNDWVERLPRIEYGIENLSRESDRRELNELLSNRAKTIVSSQLALSDWLDQWAIIQTALEVVSADTKYQGEIKQRIERNALRDVSGILQQEDWRANLFRVLAYVKKVDSSSLRQEVLTRIGSRFVDDMDVSGVDVSGAADEPTSESSKVQSLALLQEVATVFPNSMLRQDYLTAMSIKGRKENLLTDVDGLLEKYATIKTPAMQNHLKQFVLSKLPSESKRYLDSQNRDPIQAQRELRSRLGTIASVFPNTPEIKSVFDDSVLFPKLIKIPVDQHMREVGLVPSKVNGKPVWSWRHQSMANSLVPNLILGRTFNFSATVDMSKPSSQYILQVYDQSLRKYYWSFGIYRSFDGKHLVGTLAEAGTLVQSFRVPFRKQADFMISWNSGELRFQINEMTIRRYRLFENQPNATRLSFVLSPNLELSNVSLLKSDASTTPIEAKIIDGDQLALMGKYQAAIDAYRESEGSQEALMFKRLICQHRAKPTRKTTEQLANVSRSVTYPESIIASFELLADDLQQEDLKNADEHLIHLFATRIDDEAMLGEMATGRFWYELVRYFARKQKAHAQIRYQRAEIDKLKSMIDRFEPFTALEHRQFFSHFFAMAYGIVGSNDEVLDFLWDDYRDREMLVNGSSGNVVINLAWCTILQNEPSNIDRMIEVVKQEIANTHATPTMISAYELWLVRLLWAQGFEKNKKQIESMLSSLSLQSPSFGYRAESLLLLGLYHHDIGDKAQAKTFWKRAFNFYKDKPELHKTLQFTIACSLSGQLDAASFRSSLEANFDKNLRQISILRVIPKSIEKEIVDALRDMYQGEYGFDLARRLLLRSVTYKQFLEEPQINGIRSVIENGAFTDPDPKQRQLVVKLIADGMSQWQQGKLRLRHFPAILMGWIGEDPITDLKEIPELLRYRLAYVFAHRQLKKDNSELAMKLFEFASDSKDADLQEMIKSDQKNLAEIR